jgi:hypothetical protein
MNCCLLGFFVQDIRIDQIQVRKEEDAFALPNIIQDPELGNRKERNPMRKRNGQGQHLPLSR